nr:hypothetical protein [Tanacetum cinerariifolium]
MAKTMDQYMSETRADYGSGVARPKIVDKYNFELKGQFLKELRTNTLSSLDHEDANEHIKKVLDIVDLFHIPNITIDQVMLRAFPMFLTGAASRWLRNEPTGSITTWVALKTKFLMKYCPPDRTVKKMEEINNFHQEPDENLYQAWERFKELLMKCPQHYLMEMQEPSKKWLNTLRNGTMEHLGASVSVMPLLTYLNLGLGELAHTKLTAELSDKTMKYLKGIVENVLVGIGKFVFPIDFVILDMLEDIKVPLILETPFLSTARTKIDVFERKITFRVGEERRNQGNDLMPTIKEGEVIEEFGTRDDELDTGINDYPSYCENEIRIKARRFEGMLIIYNGNDEVTYQMVRSHTRFKHHTNEQCNKISPLLKDPDISEMLRWKNGSHTGTLACMRWNDEEKLKKSLTLRLRYKQKCFLGDNPESRVVVACRGCDDGDGGMLVVVRMVAVLAAGFVAAVVMVEVLAAMEMKVAASDGGDGSYSGVGCGVEAVGGGGADVDVRDAPAEEVCTPEKLRINLGQRHIYISQRRVSVIPGMCPMIDPMIKES